MKVVGGKTEHDKALVLVLCVEGFEVFVLRRVAALAGGVDQFSTGGTALASVLACSSPEAIFASISEPANIKTTAIESRDIVSPSNGLKKLPRNLTAGF
jgi:hypothetical protein